MDIFESKRDLKWFCMIFVKISVSFGLAQGLTIGGREVIAGRGLGKKDDEKGALICDGSGVTILDSGHPSPHEGLRQPTLLTFISDIQF